MQDRKYVFENGKTQIYGILSLGESGDILGYNNPNEVFWTENDENLIFFDKNKNPSSVFKKIGDEYVDEKKWHFLKPYESVFHVTKDMGTGGHHELKYKTDKIIHNLIPFYEKSLKYIQNDNIKLLEVGCLGYESIKYWLDYFPNGKIYGIDINNGDFENDRFEFFQANQRDLKRLKDIALKIGELDVVVDDGAHTYLETKNVFDAFWPKIKSGGYFIIEDWDWMSDLIVDIVQSRGELGGGIKGTRGLKGVDLGIKHLELSTNDNRAYALFQKR